MSIVDPLPPVLTHSTLNLLAGASGVGKTALVAYMARCFLRGEPLLGYQPQTVPAVGYLGADRAWTNDAERWFAKVGLAPGDIPHYAMVEDARFDTMRFRRAPTRNATSSLYAQVFTEHVDTLALPPGSVLFVDPIAIYVGARMNDYISCAMGCIDLQRIIRARHLCVIGIDHSGKQKGGDDAYLRLQDRIGGSMAKLGYTSTQMYLAGPEELETDHHTFLWNPHHAKSQTFELYQDPETGLFSHQKHVTAVSSTERHEAVDAFYTLLPPPPAIISTAYLITEYSATYSRTTIFRYIAQLVSEGRLVKTRHGAYVKVVLARESESESEA